MNELYFHGSPNENLKDILENGLKTKCGRSTFSINPLFAIKYGPKRFEEAKENIDQTSIIIFKNDGNIKPAADSKIKFDKQYKIITGYPNRYRVDALGYFPKNVKDGAYCIVPKETIIESITFTSDIWDFLKKLENDTISGKLTDDNIEKNINDASNIILDQKDVAEAMIYGLINQTIRSQMRKTELSIYAIRDCKIENSGDHPVPLFNEKQIDESIANIKTIVNIPFIKGDIKQEFNALKKILN